MTNPKRDKLTVTQEPLVYVKKQQVSVEEMKDVKKEEGKKIPPKEKNKKETLPHNTE